MMMKHTKGFTLIELMVVVTIIGIIAAFAFPSYQNSVLKSHRTDAKVALTEGATRQERIYSETSSYAGASDLAKLVTNSDGSSSPDGFYTISVTIPAGASCSNSGNAPFHCYTLTATAKGEQAKDTACATLSITHLGQKTSTGGGTCW